VFLLHNFVFIFVQKKIFLFLKEYLDVYNKSLDKLLPDMKLMPGARRLIEHLQKNGIQTSICTSSSSAEFSKKVDKCEDLVKKVWRIF